MTTLKQATLACAALVFLPAGALRDQYEKPAGSQPAAAAAPAPQAAAAAAPQLTATLVDAAAKAQRQAATVKVTVKGLAIIDPAIPKEQPRVG